MSVKKLETKFEGRIEFVYEHAMTKALLDRYNLSVNFINVRFSKDLYLYISFFAWLPEVTRIDEEARPFLVKT